MANQRRRIIRAVAETDVIVLKGEARLLFEYLENSQNRQISKEAVDKNPYDIGQVFLDAKY